MKFQFPSFFKKNFKFYYFSYLKYTLKISQFLFYFNFLFKQVILLQKI